MQRPGGGGYRRLRNPVRFPAPLERTQKETEGGVCFGNPAGTGTKTDSVVFRDILLQKRVGDLQDADTGVLRTVGGMQVCGVDEDKILGTQLNPGLVQRHGHAAGFNEQNLQAVVPVGGNQNARILIGKAADRNIRIHHNGFMDRFPRKLFRRSDAGEIASSGEKRSGRRIRCMLHADLPDPAPPGPDSDWVKIFLKLQDYYPKKLIESQYRPI